MTKNITLTNVTIKDTMSSIVISKLFSPLNFRINTIKKTLQLSMMLCSHFINSRISQTAKGAKFYSY